jgi:hypothetical protein
LFLAYAMEKKIERRVHKGMTNIKSTTEVFCRGKSNEANTWQQWFLTSVRLRCL